MNTVTHANAEPSTTTSRAVAHRVQTRLTVGPSRDVYEQEAERVADAVVGPSNAAAGVAPATRAVPTISRLRGGVRQRMLSRQGEEEEPQARLQRQEEEEPQARLQRQEEEEPQARLQRQEEEEPQARLQRQEDEEPQARLQRQEEEEPQARLQRQEEEEPQARLQRQEEEEPQARLQRQEEEEPQARLQRQTSATSSGGQVTPQLEARIHSTKGGGRPLPGDVRVSMEEGIGADFGNVRVHTGAAAVQMSTELGAQAFTHGRDVYFNEGRYQPESTRGQKLIAHELTHTVQQGAAVRRKAEVSSVGGVRVQRGFLDRVGGAIGGAVSSAANAVSGAVSAVGEGIASLGGAALDALLGRLGNFARGVPGYTLLTVILGRDPITQDDVPRTATNLVRGLMSLVPGGNEKFKQLEQSGALERAFTWVSRQLVTLGLTWPAIRGAFTRAWDSLSVSDAAHPMAAFNRIMGIFRPILSGIRRFASAILDKILEFIFEGFLGPAGARVLAVLNRVRSTFTTIVRNPVGFIGNLVTAARRGIGNFVVNIRQHLITGLISWLTGALANGPIQLPQKWDLKGILHLVLQILGLTWDRIRPRLVKHVGERVVRVAETGVAIVKRLITEGPIALWHMIREKASAIKEQVMGGIRNWVVTRLVTGGVTRLLSFLNPAGAVVQAILAIYNTVMFFVENWQRISQFVQSVFNSITNIAMGRLGPAVKAVEGALARTLPIIFNFLARLLGLGNIGRAITNVIERIRKPIDAIVDKAIAGMAKMAKKLVQKGKAGVKALFQWWKKRKKFKNKSGQSHTLFFKGKGKSAKVMIKSDEMELEKYLNDQPAGDPKVVEAKAQLVSLKVITRKDVKTKQEASDITDAITGLSKLLMSLAEIGNANRPRKADWSYPAYGHSKVDKLSTASSRGGSPATAEPDWWDFIKKDHQLQDKKRGHWERMHLISRRVGGPGNIKDNLIPAPHSVNRGPLVESFENAAYNLVEPDKKAKPNVIWLDVQGKGLRPKDPSVENYTKQWFFSKVTMEGGLYFYKKEGGWTKDSKARFKEDVAIPPPVFNPTNVPSLSVPSATALKGVDPVFTESVTKPIKQEIKIHRPEPFADFDNFKERMRGRLTERVWERWEAHVLGRIRALEEDGKIKYK